MERLIGESVGREGSGGRRVFSLALGRAVVVFLLIDRHPATLSRAKMPVFLENGILLIWIW